MSSILKNCRKYPREKFAAGEFILKQGDQEDVILILVKGVAEVSFEGSAIATISNRGAILGEIGVLLNQPHTADVIAVEDCTLYVIREASKVLARSPKLAGEISRVLARRLASASRALASLNKEKTPEETGDVDHGMLWQEDDQFGQYLLNPPESPDE